MKDRPGDEERNRNSRLQTAVAKSDVGLTGRLLGEGADPNGLVRIPLLHRAIRHESLPIVRLLVEAGADIERTNHAGWAPLTHADANEQEAIVEYLVGAGADLTTRERHGFSHVHRAVRAGDRARLSLLLRGGADVNAQSADGSTPLMHAAQTCDTDLSGSLLQILLQHRADPDLCDYEGWAPLASATYEDAAHTNFNNHPIVRVPLLLGAGAEPNAGTYPPLLAAISQEGQNWAVIEALIRAGANPDIVDDHGTTLLLRAMQVSIDGEFIAQCAAAVSDVDRTANDGIRPVKEVLKEWFPELTVEEQLDPLLALRATGTDFTSISDSIPSWLIGTGSELGSNAPQEAVERFTGLRQLFLDTQRALTR